jgi:hypothetical protein
VLRLGLSEKVTLDQGSEMGREISQVDFMGREFQEEGAARPKALSWELD